MITFSKWQEAYNRLSCPVCGRKPLHTPTGVDYCGHPEMDLLLEEAHERLLAEESASQPRLVKPFSPGVKPVLKVGRKADPDSESTK